MNKQNILNNISCNFHKKLLLLSYERIYRKGKIIMGNIVEVQNQQDE